MAWVRFSEPFRWVPPTDRRLTIRYRAGSAYSVTQACAAAAIEAGAAVRIKAPRRGEAKPATPGARRHGEPAFKGRVKP